MSAESNAKKAITTLPLTAADRKLIASSPVVQKIVKAMNHAREHLYYVIRFDEWITEAEKQYLINQGYNFNKPGHIGWDLKSRAPRPTHGK
jgi:hypothetical protein